MIRKTLIGVNYKTRKPFKRMYNRKVQN